MKKIMIISISLCLLMVFAAACSADGLKNAATQLNQAADEVASQSPTQEHVPSTEPMATASAEEAPSTQNTSIADTKITSEEAIAAVTKQYPDFEIGRAELESENGKVYWDVEIYDKKSREDHSVYVDANTGKVVTNNNVPSGLNNEPAITRQQAEKAALEKYAGYTVTSIDYDDENGKYYWNIELTDKKGFEKDINVDAQTGEVFLERD